MIHPKTGSGKELQERNMMKRRIAGFGAVAAVAALSLAACGGGGRGGDATDANSAPESGAEGAASSAGAGFDADKEIHGVLSPNDGIARAILTSSEQAGQAQPVVSGLDAENESIAWIAAGKQYSTVAKADPRPCC